MGSPMRLCLPAVMRFNLEAAEPHYARLARMFDVPSAPDRNDAAAQAVDEVEGMIERLGITPRTAKSWNPAGESGEPVRQRLR